MRRTTEQEPKNSTVERGARRTASDTLVELTEEFFKQKGAERRACWDTPEGEARMVKIKAKYEK